jgi:hypothetical protein
VQQKSSAYFCNEAKRSEGEAATRGNALHDLGHFVAAIVAVNRTVHHHSIESFNRVVINSFP